LSYRFLPFNVADCSDFHDNNTPRESKPVIFNSAAVIPIWLSRHSQGDSKVTGGDVAARAPERKATAAIANVARVMVAVLYQFVVAVRSAKDALWVR
jgi:hypothetical protein